MIYQTLTLWYVKNPSNQAIKDLKAIAVRVFEAEVFS